MSIVHARIDYRLIHGQVITKWLKRSDANKIIVIDDPLSRDSFLAEVYKMAAPSDVEVIMTSIEDTLQRWNNNNFYEGKLLILFKSIDSALKTIQGALMLDELQVGGVENTPGRKIVFNQISLNHEDADKLQIIEDKNIKVYFQTIPEEDPASLQKIKSKLS
ncbi:PTS sugar transporter subunit IIB [Escherichia albertii]|uniref:PTS system mannose/fructose/N-acetylgalactosamine-transporter subunit IIB n=1 Tax=Escherichia albertii TaxID=208962 RepID=UPI0010790F0B|nr:PTS sugar transporter subunit IIB [Escherichia albertii]EFA6625470.1 PTS mannose/fructose/sorbose transporter subunit IIB [Escherichia albertii]EFA7087790.1 PTS mannose/fructose/sorbose transporter subunit IIB [Escherichia albertii]EFF0832475.1 PTS sugar transporter subunit IIB [Escherichia albertii]EFF1430793.1 PTS sugar transporter subunit IIB [Escherichia albertii]EFL5785947.1 PTS sugar transporter subunit IIB [Escherichia albertii]